jgi:nitroimidazol reductase NimA-like FMN-containing flavoprotein (pyridoxamine 5'-phosphate oxidase superfamily)
MRRNDRELTELQDIISVIEKCDVCRLAFFDVEYPYILPVNFGWDVTGDRITLYFHGALEGKKYDLMEKNNKVSFEMDCSHRLVLTEDSKSCTMEYESVIGNGILEYVADEDKYNALCLIMKHYRAEAFEFNQAVIPHTKVFKLTVTSLTGKARMKKSDK